MLGDCSQKQIMEYFDNLDVARHGFLSVDQLKTPIMQVTGLDKAGARAGRARCPGWIREVTGLD